MDKANDGFFFSGWNLKVLQRGVQVEDERGPVFLRDAHTSMRCFHVPAGIQKGTSSTVTQEVDQELYFPLYTVLPLFAQKRPRSASAMSRETRLWATAAIES